MYQPGHQRACARPLVTGSLGRSPQGVFPMLKGIKLLTQFETAREWALIAKPKTPGHEEGHCVTPEHFKLSQAQDIGVLPSRNIYTT